MLIYAGDKMPRPFIIIPVVTNERQKRISVILFFLIKTLTVVIFS